RLELPRELGWNARGDVAAVLANGTVAPLRDLRLHLFVPHPVIVLPPDSAPADTTRRDRVPRPVVAATAEGTELTFALGVVAPEAEARVAQVVRMPPFGLERRNRAYDGRDRFVVRAWLTTAAGAPVGAVVQDTLRIRPGSETVVGGCGGVDDVPVSRSGVGPVRLGMTVDALRAVCPEALDTTWTGAEGMRETGQAVRVAGRPLLALTVGDTVARIVVDSAGLRTAAGLGVGSTLAELRGRYGRACAGVGEGRAAVWFPNAPGISFGLDSVAAREWVAAGGGDPAALPDEARVTSLWVRRGLDDCPARPGEGSGR
ncbi:MAG TPA: hypothetical protein VFX98_03120, partial [Longimicrobiaceae bacterium]|nr:hypothetical protein [Longimicrobiaceae bacterium]